VRNSSAAVPVIVGLAAGIALIALFGSLFSSPLGHLSYLGLDIIDISGLSGAGKLTLEGNDQLIIRIMLQNATVRELLQGRNDAYVSGIADMEDKCAFGSCARVEIGRMDDPSQRMQVLIDYSNHRVASIQRSDGW
jgi:hypothetical protein